MPRFEGPMACRFCGCTEDAACRDPETGGACFWFGENVCSACVAKLEGPALLTWLADYAGTLVAMERECEEVAGELRDPDTRHRVELMESTLARARAEIARRSGALA